MNNSQSSARLVSLLAGLAASILVLLSVLGREPQYSQLGAASLNPLRPEPVLSAEAYLVGFMHHSEPLLSRRAWKRLAPASLTKLMTAAVALEKLGPTDTVTLSAEAAAVEERSSGAAKGETFGRDDLLRLALGASANDAAIALAEAAGIKQGAFDSNAGLEAFVWLMNAKAGILGMDDTNFVNPTGLDASGHYMSAVDLARIAEYILDRHPNLWEISREQAAAVSAAGGRRYIVENTNDLLKEFPAIRGGKTGFTDNAKGALLLLYPVPPDQTAIIVILKSDDRFGDGRKVIKWLEENF